MRSFKTDAELVFANILESWGLMLVDRPKENHVYHDVAEPFYVGSLDFKGVIDGAYSIICQKDFALCLTQNLIGTDIPVGDVEISDTIKELTNVLTGNCLTTFYGEEAVFTLLSPQCELQTWEQVQVLLKNPVVTLLGDDQWVSFTFSLNS